MNELMAVAIEEEVRFEGRGRQRRLVARSEPETAAPETGKVPRIARLMALAIRLEGLIASGVVKNYADVAGLGHVSRARISQIMNLRLLAPDIQEEILFLPKTVGKGGILICHLQAISSSLDWTDQRRQWRRLASSRT